MRRRCLTPTNKDYKHYGGRGISIDPSWDNFDTFAKDMGPCPSAEHTIERRDVNGDYTPDNCYWETFKQQKRNTRRTRWVIFNGVKMALSEASEKSGIHVQTIYYRVYKMGMTHQEALDYKGKTT